MEIEREIIGFFDGEHMVSEETGKMYPVPQNYASKSKLIEGDKLKLSLPSIIYKQLEKAKSIKTIAKVIKKDDELVVMTMKGKIYKILNFSITYFNLREDQEVLISIPADEKGYFAAIEMVL